MSPRWSLPGRISPDVAPTLQTGDGPVKDVDMDTPTPVYHVGAAP